MPQSDHRRIKPPQRDEAVERALEYHEGLWKARKNGCDTATVVCPFEQPFYGHTQPPRMELLITIVEATLVPKAHDRIYCFVQRDSELRQTAPAVRGCQRFPEWHEVVRFPLYEEETRGQRNILGSRRLFLSCGTDSGGFLGMTSVLLNGVFLRNTPTLDKWYVLKDGTGECGEIHLELAVADRPKRMKSVPAITVSPPSRECAGALSRRSTITHGELHAKNLSKRKETEFETPLPDLTGQVVTAQKFSSAGGGYSDVWKGCWENRSLTVAIKTLRTPLNPNALAKLEKRLQREVRIWRKLKHKNVAPLYGLASGFGRVSAMVCKWYDEGNMVQYLQRRGPNYPVSERLRLLTNVVAGLCHLHELKIIHGDLKGANVLIDDEGNASLCDFGLSSIVADNDSQYFSSTIGATIRWAAPEVHRVQSPSIPPDIAPASDIYSFGSVMLEALSGCYPYYNLKSDLSVVAELQHGRKPPRPPQPPISEEHWAFMTLCWANDMDKRPDVVVVHDQLRQFYALTAQ